MQYGRWNMGGLSRFGGDSDTPGFGIRTRGGSGFRHEGVRARCAVHGYTGKTTMGSSMFASRDRRVSEEGRKKTLHTRLPAGLYIPQPTNYTFLRYAR